MYRVGDHRRIEEASYFSVRIYHRCLINMCFWLRRFGHNQYAFLHVKTDIDYDQTFSARNAY